MSTGPLPTYIEPFKWADRAAEVEASQPLKSFTRLLQGAVDDKGAVAITSKLFRDAQGHAFVEGEAHAEVTLTCQRCLGPVQVALDVDFRLAFVREEGDADALAEDEDYLVIGDETVSLQDIVEDELLLALPLVPNHDDCEAYIFEQEEESVVEAPKRENPFLVLAQLKEQKPKKS